MPRRVAPSSFAHLSAQVPGSTPELMEWIAQQSQSGFEQRTLLQLLLDRGWPASTAKSALECVTASKLLEQPNHPRLPAPILTGNPCSIDVGDRLVDVLMTLEHPRLVVFGNVLSAEECDAIVTAAQPHLRRSRTVETQTGGEEINADRTSEGMFFQRGQTVEVSRLEQRLAHLLQWPMDHGEGLQVLHYGPGAQYKPHHDYFDPIEPGTPQIVQRGGQRVATIIVYLNEPQAGGATYFPETRLRVFPRRGHAVYFGYATPTIETLTLHGGEPVIRGEKWIATKWLRERPFH